MALIRDKGDIVNFVMYWKHKETDSCLYKTKHHGPNFLLYFRQKHNHESEYEHWTYALYVVDVVLHEIMV